MTLFGNKTPRGSDGKDSVCNAGDPGSVSGKGSGNPLQDSRLGNPTDRGAWQATVHGASELNTAE